MTLPEARAAITKAGLHGLMEDTKSPAVAPHISDTDHAEAGGVGLAPPPAASPQFEFPCREEAEALQWLPQSPFALGTERDYVCQLQWKRVFRALFVRDSKDKTEL